MERRKFLAGAAAAIVASPFSKPQPRRERIFQKFGPDGRLHRVEFDDLRPGDRFVSLDLPLDETSVARGDLIFTASSFPRDGAIDVARSQRIGQVTPRQVADLLWPSSHD